MAAANNAAAAAAAAASAQRTATPTKPAQKVLSADVKARLAALEDLCTRKYNPVSPADSQKAALALAPFSTNAECIPQCQLILDNSTNEYTLILGSQSLLQLVTKFWNSFSKQQTVEIRNYLLNYMAVRCATLPKTVTIALVRVLMRITKFGWNDDPVHRDISTAITKFLQHTVKHCILGLEMCSALVEEMNQPTGGQSITAHRKTAVAFRDKSLFFVFQLTLTTLKQILTKQVKVSSAAEDTNLKRIALTLARNCLAFDSIGSHPDEASDDVQTIQIPSTWRPIIEDAATLKLFLDLFVSVDAERAATCMECIVLLASVRRSMFSSDEERIKFLGRLSLGTRELMKNQQTVLANPDVYHQFCRLLYRMKTNSQISADRIISSHKKPKVSRSGRTRLDRKEDLTPFDAFADGGASSMVAIASSSSSSGTAASSLFGNSEQSQKLMELHKQEKERDAKREAMEMVVVEGYKEWISLVAAFTSKSFKQWKYFPNSIHYLVGLWARFVMDLPSLTGDLPAFLDQFIPPLTHQFVAARLELAKTNATSLDEIFEEPDHSDQLKQIATLGRYKYAKMRDEFKTQLSALAAVYKECVQALNEKLDASKSALLASRLAQVEGQLAIEFYIIGSIIGGHIPSSANHDEHQAIDAELCAMLLLILPLVDHRLASPNPIKKCKHLDLAILYFLGEFRKNHIGRPGRMKVLSEGREPGAPFSLGFAPTDSKQGIYARISAIVKQPIGEKDMLTTIINKIGVNLKFYSTEHEIVTKCLELLEVLTQGYTTAKLCAGLPPIKHMLQNHAGAAIANTFSTPRLRSSFYVILSRILFMQSMFPAVDADDSHAAAATIRFAVANRTPAACACACAGRSTDESIGEIFEAFMAPFDRHFAGISSASDPRSPAVHNQAIVLCSSLQGIVEGLTDRRSYLMFFDWLYPKYLSDLLRLVETWWDTPTLTTPVLQFVAEFVHNKSGRIQFDASSANGILLFREVSKFLNIYGTRLIGWKSDEKEKGEKLYKNRIKGISLCLSLFTHALSGNYVNFGVFALYNDKALSTSLTIMLKLVLSLPLAESLSYQKMAKFYFSFLEAAFQNHTDMIAEYDSKIVLALLTSLHEGLLGFDSSVASQCAQALDHVFTWHFIHLKKKTRSKGSKLLEKHLSSSGELIPSMFHTLMNALLFEQFETSLSFSHPVLALLVFSEQAMKLYQQRLLAAQSKDAQSKLTAAFAKLMEGIKLNVEPENKERWTMNVAKFRMEISTYCVRPT